MVTQAKKIGVFIDGQSINKSCKNKFKVNTINPVLLAHKLAGDDRDLKMINYYIGVLNEKDVHVDNHADYRKELERLEFMKTCGVDVITTKLYVVDTGHKEKGVDVNLALGVVEALATGKIDVAVVCSASKEVSQVVSIFEKIDKDVSIEGAFVTHNNKYLKFMDDYDKVHIIDETVAKECEDTLDFSKIKGEDDPFVKEWKDRHSDLMKSLV